MNAIPPPVLPDSAPFTPEQRGWLNGYIAAITSGAPGVPAAPAPGSPFPAPPEALPSNAFPPVTIVWGSQTGNAEGLARKAAKKLSAQGAAPAVHDLAAYPVEQLLSEEVLLVITSTYGDGEPPDNAADFHAFLHSGEAPKFDTTRFAVFGLGDTEYPDFCACARQIDARLEELGATRLAARVEADVDFEDPFNQWMSALLGTLPALQPAAA